MTKDNGNMDPEREVALLCDLSHRDLTAHWQTRYRAAPPKGMSRRLLLLALAYRIQAHACSDLDSRTDRYLRALAAGMPETVPPPAPAAILKPGMRLMREWNGRTHIVDVVEDGFYWKGQSYSSLSPIARAITGARWSGPRFFGLAAQRS